MDLAIRHTDGLLGLDEYRTLHESNVYFANEFGIIKDSKILLHDNDFTIDIREVAYMRLIKKEKNGYLAVMLLTLALTMMICFSRYHILLLPVLTVIAMIVAAFALAKRDTYTFQIVMCRAEQKMIRIPKKQVKACKIFIVQYAHFRVLNPVL